MSCMLGRLVRSGHTSSALAEYHLRRGQHGGHTGRAGQGNVGVSFRNYETQTLSRVAGSSAL